MSITKWTCPRRTKIRTRKGVKNQNKALHSVQMDVLMKKERERERETCTMTVILMTKNLPRNGVKVKITKQNKNNKKKFSKRLMT